MKSFLILLAICGSCWALAERADAHGFNVSLENTSGGKQLVGVNNGAPTPFPRLFAEYWLDSAPDDYLAIHGGITATTGFSGTPNLALELFGPVWYSDGGEAIPVSGGVQVEGISFDGVTQIDSVMIDGVGPLGGPMAVTAVSDHSVGWMLSPYPAPAGTYGFAYRVIGTQGSPAESLLASDLLVVALSTPGFGGAAREQSLVEIYQAIVPEPTSLALLGFGLVGVAVVARARRQRSK